MATFLVVSFSERVMSFSVISCGFFLSRSSFCSVARFAKARFFCSIESGPSLPHTVSFRVPPLSPLHEREGKRGYVHEVHYGYPSALREHAAADAGVVERLPAVVLLVVRVELCGDGDALCPAHEVDEAGDKVVDVECACTSLHCAGLRLTHLGHGHEEV